MTTWSAAILVAWNWWSKWSLSRLRASGFSPWSAQIHLRAIVFSHEHSAKSKGCRNAMIWILKSTRNDDEKAGIVRLVESFRVHEVKQCDLRWKHIEQAAFFFKFFASILRTVTCMMHIHAAKLFFTVHFVCEAYKAFLAIKSCKKGFLVFWMFFTIFWCI